jgi:D-arabinose 1-dehydrogenase-like Zn-dependent alcohol dehydrogenase
MGASSLRLSIAPAQGMVGTHTNRRLAIRLGAEEVYDSLDVDVIDAIRRKHPDDVDAVLDVVNGADAIQRDAEILIVGQSQGACLPSLLR